MIQYLNIIIFSIGKNGLRDLQKDYKEKKLKKLTAIFKPDQTLTYLEEVNDDWFRRKPEEEK